MRKLVFTSCAGVVIDHGDLNGVNETQRLPTRAPTAYLATKALAERHVLAANGPQLATVALRPHLLWGPGEAAWLPRLATLAKAGRLRLFGEPGKKIDNCYVDNAADAHLAALDRLEPGAAIAGKAYFITQGEPASVEGFINGLLRAAGYPAETRRLSGTLRARAGVDRRRCAARFTGADPLVTPRCARAVQPGRVVQHRRRAARSRLCAAGRHRRRSCARVRVPCARAHARR